MKKKFTHAGKLLLVLILLLCSQQVIAQKKIVGYAYTGGSPSSIDYTKITHLNLAFENPDDAGNLSYTSTNDQFVQKAHAVGVKLLVSIGGGSASENSTIRSRYFKLINDANRATFVSKIVSYINAHQLDGIDVDLEGPAINIDYEKFIKALRTSLPAGKLLTAALSHTNLGYDVPASAIQVFDFVNVMAYDKGWGQAVHHSPYDFAVTSLDWWVTNKAMPKSKLVLGVPFYGWTGTTGSGELSFAEILTKFGVAAANVDQTSNVYYNGIPTIKKKSQLVMDGQYGGIMIWELGLDASGSYSLLKAINDILRAPSAGVVTVFEHCNFGGKAVGLPVGDYTLTQLNSLGILKNFISSFRFNPGYEAVVYQSADFTGTSYTFSADDACLVDNGINDWINSLKVRVKSPAFSQTIQAENYSSMSGIQTEATTDTGGGLNIGWVDTGDWMAYNNIVIPSSGSYLIEYRVATPYDLGRISLEQNGGAVKLGAIDVPNTQGWQIWKTISHTVTLNAGTYSFSLFAAVGRFNVNWWRISRAGARLGEEGVIAGSELENVKVYPSPAFNTLSLSAKQIPGARINIIGADGIKHKVSTASESATDVSSLKPGVYTIEISVNGKRLTRKFIKS